jgi:hypothetical protein
VALTWFLSPTELVLLHPTSSSKQVRQIKQVFLQKKEKGENASRGWRRTSSVTPESAYQPRPRSPSERTVTIFHSPVTLSHDSSLNSKQVRQIKQVFLQKKEKGENASRGWRRTSSVGERKSTPESAYQPRPRSPSERTVTIFHSPVTLSHDSSLFLHLKQQTGQADQTSIFAEKGERGECESGVEKHGLAAHFIKLGEGGCSTSSLRLTCW